MRILYLGNNWVGWQVLKWLKQQNEQVVGIVVHPPKRQKYGEELTSTVDLPAERIFYGDALCKKQTLDKIKATRPDIGLSIFFGYIVRPAFLQLLPQGCLNLHPAFLPYNRGAYPNVWSIVEGTPAGVTLHFIDAGVDTGDIVAQRQVPVQPTDTGGRLYRRLERACVELFKESWSLIRSGRVPRLPQAEHTGTFHRVRDAGELDIIDLERSYSARELIDIIRARTFPPHRGAYIERDGRRIYLRLQLLEEDEFTEIEG